MSCPTVSAADHQNPVRGQNPGHLVSSDSLCRIDNQQVDQPVDQWEFGAGEPAGGVLAVDHFGEQHGSGRGNVVGVTVETVDLVAVVGSQGPGEAPFATAEVDDQAAADLGLFDQHRGVFRGSSGNREGGAADKKCRQKTWQET